ncbi:MAG: hypothetical protein KJ767_01800 [Nanoarchaeota archaeon]|nr:hypothetical protein [Nanoarchaeota archaeon]
MKIGINFSGAIADINALKSKYAKVLFDIDLPIEETEPYIGKKQKLDSEQYHLIQKLVYNDKVVLNSTQEIPDSFNSMRKLREDNHDLTIIVSKFSLEESEEYVRDWLMQKSNGYFGDLDIIHIKNEYNDIYALNEKNIKVLIDDNFRRLELISGNEKSNIDYLFFFRKPYNAMYHVPEDWNRLLVHYWNEIYQKICELNKFNPKNSKQSSVFSQRDHQQ